MKLKVGMYVRIYLYIFSLIHDVEENEKHKLVTQGYNVVS